MFVKDDENQALKKVQEAKTELEDARQQIINVNVLFWKNPYSNPYNKETL